MENTNVRALVPVAATGWTELKEIATVFHKSGMAPASFKSPEQVIAACVVARDLGLPPSTVLQGALYVINGVVSTNSRTMMALILRSNEVKISIEKDDAKGSVSVTMSREAAGLSYTATWDEKRVQESRANMSPNNEEKWPWKLHRQTMKTWRAIAEAARIVAPDLIGGLYLADEVDVPIKVVDGDMVIDAEIQVLPNDASKSAPTVKEAEPAPAAEDTAANMEKPKFRNMNEFYAAAQERWNHDKKAIAAALTAALGKTVLQAQREDNMTMPDLWAVLEQHMAAEAAAEKAA